MRKTINCIAVVFISLVFACNNGNKDKREDKAFQETHEEKSDTIPEYKVPAKATLSYKTYCNARFGYCIEYPSEILYPQGESGNGDGQIFKSKDAENALIVFRDFRDNIDPDIQYTIEMAFNEDTWGNNPDFPKKVITYKKLGESFFVVSGYNNGKIFYQKTILSDTQLVTGILVYKESDKEIYNSIAESVFSSFR